MVKDGMGLWKVLGLDPNVDQKKSMYLSKKKNAVAFKVFLWCSWA